MVTKRTPIRRFQKTQFTPALIEQFKKACKDPDNESLALHVMLHREPWQCDVMFVNADGSPPEFTRSEEPWHAEDRKQALEIRRALERETK